MTPDYQTIRTVGSQRWQRDPAPLTASSRLYRTGIARGSRPRIDVRCTLSTQTRCGTLNGTWCVYLVLGRPSARHQVPLDGDLITASAAWLACHHDRDSAPGCVTYLLISHTARPARCCHYRDNSARSTHDSTPTTSTRAEWRPQMEPIALARNSSQSSPTPRSFPARWPIRTANASRSPSSMRLSQRVSDNIRQPIFCPRDEKESGIDRNRLPRNVFRFTNEQMMHCPRVPLV